MIMARSRWWHVMTHARHENPPQTNEGTWEKWGKERSELSKKPYVNTRRALKWSRRRRRIHARLSLSAYAVPIWRFSHTRSPLWAPACACTIRECRQRLLKSLRGEEKQCCSTLTILLLLNAHILSRKCDQKYWSWEHFNLAKPHFAKQTTNSVWS